MSTAAESLRRYYLDVMGIQCWQLRGKAALKDSTCATVIVDNNGNRQQLEANAQQGDNDFRAAGKQTVTGHGNLSAQLMFVLPASDSDSASSETHDLFTKMLTAINVDIDDVYISTLLTCKQPPSHTVLPEENRHCLVQLKQQVQLLQPKHLIVLGETTIQYFLQKDLSIDDLRAMNAAPQFEIASLPVFASYSPQELLQQPAHKRKAWADLQQLQKMLASD